MTRFVSKILNITALRVVGMMSLGDIGYEALAV